MSEEIAISNSGRASLSLQLQEGGTASHHGYGVECWERQQLQQMSNQAIKEVGTQQA